MQKYAVKKKNNRRVVILNLVQDLLRFRNEFGMTKSQIAFVKKYISVRALIIINILIVISLLATFFLIRGQKPGPFSKTVASFVSQCTKNPDWRGCYSRSLGVFTKNHSLQTSIELLGQIQKKDKKTQDCHVITHRIASAQLQKNPSRWQEILEAVPLLSCNYGYVHGVIEGRAADGGLQFNEKTIHEICDLFKNKPLASDLVSSCAHAMGHILLVENNADVGKSIDLCRVYSQNLAYQCFGGVFMENVTQDNLVTHGIASYRAWDDSLIQDQETLCRSYVGQIARACWQHMSHLYLQKTPYNPQKLFDQCGDATQKDFQDVCFRQGTLALVQKAEVENSYLISICSVYNSDPSGYERCVYVVAQTLIQASLDFIPRVKLFCALVPKEHKEICYQTFGKTLRFRVSEAKRKELCSEIPREYIEVCKQEK